MTASLGSLSFVSNVPPEGIYEIIRSLVRSVAGDPTISNSKTANNPSPVKDSAPARREYPMRNCPQESKYSDAFRGSPVFP